jgi:probable addiction module antidote protein
MRFSRGRLRPPFVFCAASALPALVQRNPMAEKLTKYDPAIALVDDEEVAAFLTDALETGDAASIAKSLGVVARAKGMSEIAVKTGLSREQLYRSFSSEGNPTLKTTLAVMKALGVDLALKVHVDA